jgi:hypothetical protein
MPHVTVLWKHLAGELFENQYKTEYSQQSTKNLTYVLITKQKFSFIAGHKSSSLS